MGKSVLIIKNNSLHTDLIWLAGGRVVTAFIAIASIRIMTSLLEPKDYGIYVLLIAFQGFCGLTLISPVGLFINRHTHAWWDDGTLLKRLIGYNRYVIAVSTGISLAVVVWWPLYSGADQAIDSTLLSALAVGAIVYLTTLNGTFIGILNMLGFRSASVRWMLTSSIFSLGFSSLFAFEYRTATSWVLGQVVGMAVGTLGAGAALRQYQATRKLIVNGLIDSLSALNRQTILTYCLPLGVATGLLWLQNTGYRFLVAETWGPAELGLLAVGLGISSQIWSVVESLFTQFLNPYFFRHITRAQSDEQKSAILSDMVNVVWPIYAVLAGFNLVFAISLLTILANERYHAAETFIIFGVLIEFSRCTANLWSYAAQIEQRTTKYIFSYGLGAAIVWLGAVVVTYMHGDILMMGVVLVISSLTICAAMVFVMHRMIPIKLDIGRWLAGLSILAVCLTSVIFMPIKADGLMINIGLIIIGLVIAAGMVFILLWRNPALSRLLAVSLRVA